MPNYKNIIHPVNIFGVGRSGTTLLSALISSTDTIQNCNETFGVIMGTWSGALASEFSDDKIAVGVAKELYAVKSVHGALINAMPSNKESWIQKIAGIPNNFVWETFISEKDKQHFHGYSYVMPASMVISALQQTFPFSLNVLIARNPLEIAISRSSYSGWDRSDTLSDIDVAYRFYILLKNQFVNTIGYSILAKKEPAFISNIFNSIGVKFSLDYMDVFKHKFVPSKTSILLTEENINKYIIANPLTNNEINKLQSIYQSYSELNLLSEFPDYLYCHVF
jgi:hypothetical protein